MAIDPSVAELAVEAEVTLLPTGQLLCAADDPTGAQFLHFVPKFPWIYAMKWGLYNEMHTIDRLKETTTHNYDRGRWGMPTMGSDHKQSRNRL